MSLRLENKYQAFNSQNNSLDARELIAASYEFFGDKLACFSSFGSYSALLLKFVADVNKDIPILFLETGKHFSETLEYVEDIKRTLGLRNIIALKPDENILKHADVNGNLWSSNVDRCCWIRKVEPLDRHLAEAGYEAIITGRRHYQTKERGNIQKIELDDQGRIRINPVAFWDKARIKQVFAENDLIQHPLVAQGYPSIGCAPCTRQVKPGEDERSGRWAHIMDIQPEAHQKTECGIHLNRDDIKDFAI